MLLSKDSEQTLLVRGQRSLRVRLGLLHMKLERNTKRDFFEGRTRELRGERETPNLARAIKALRRNHDSRREKDCSFRIEEKILLNDDIFLDCLEKNK